MAWAVLLLFVFVFWQLRQLTKQLALLNKRISDLEARAEDEDELKALGPELRAIVESD